MGGKGKAHQLGVENEVSSGFKCEKRDIYTQTETKNGPAWSEY